MFQHDKATSLTLMDFIDRNSASQVLKYGCFLCVTLCITGFALVWMGAARFGNGLGDLIYVAFLGWSALLCLGVGIMGKSLAVQLIAISTAVIAITVCIVNLETFDLSRIVF